MKINANTTITVLDAIKVANQFLEDRRDRTGGDTPLDLILGDMNIILEDGKEVETSDPAIWEDWQNAVKKVLQN